MLRGRRNKGQQQQATDALPSTEKKRKQQAFRASWQSENKFDGEDIMFQDSSFTSILQTQELAHGAP